MAHPGEFPLDDTVEHDDSAVEKGALIIIPSPEKSETPHTYITGEADASSDLLGANLSSVAASQKERLTERLAIARQISIHLTRPEVRALFREVFGDNDVPIIVAGKNDTFDYIYDLLRADYPDGAFVAIIKEDRITFTAIKPQDLFLEVEA